MKTKDTRSLPAAAQEDLRVKAVKAVLNGKTQVEIAGLFGVTRRAVNDWLRTYRSGGFKALKAKSQGRPKGGSLKPWQSARIAKSVIDRHPEQLKLPFSLWTREAVGQLIESKYGIGLSVWTVGRYLARWGFTPQKPLRRAFEQDPEAVQCWLSYQYPAIKRWAKREGAEIHWGDEMGLRSDHVAGRSYGIRGVTPIIPGTGQRFGCNMISALTNRGKLSFMVFKHRFRADVFIDFLRRLIRHARRKVYLILDGHPVHRAKKVKQWLIKHSQEIKLHFLPSYSPELNPDEVLNQDVKSNALGRQRPHTQQDLINKVRSYLYRRKKQPYIVRNYFSEAHVKYAA